MIAVNTVTIFKLILFATKIRLDSCDGKTWLRKVCICVEKYQFAVFN